MAADQQSVPTRRHRPRSTTVFIAAFAAGAAAAVGINRALDVHLAQSKPQVECEPIFVALRSLPQGVPVTVWDVALRDWPKAMMPTSAVRVNDSFEGCLLKHPLREGQPLLTVQLVKPDAPGQGQGPAAASPAAEDEVFVPPVPATAVTPPEPVSEPTLPPATTAVEASETFVATAVTPPETPEAATAVGDAQSPHTIADTAVIVPESEAMLPEGPAETGTSESDLAGILPDATPEQSADEVAPPTDQPETDHVAAAAPDVPTPAQSEPMPEPVAGLADAEPQTLEQPALAGIQRQEPTPAAPPLAAAPTPTPVDLGPQLLGPHRSDPSSADVPSRPLADIASLPSVMARETESVPAETGGMTSSSARYLVVPERIARQADTSFTTPTAPTVGSVASERDTPAPNRQPAVAERKPRTQQQTPRPSTVQQQPRGSGRTASGGSRKPQSPAPSPRQQPPPQPKPTERAETESRTWSSMFPNVSAGLEAIGGWRSRGREAVADEAQPKQPRR
jgi:hypothetical protein